MGLEPFTFDRDRASRFVDFEYALYSSDPQWIPPLRSTRCGRMQPSFWFHRIEGNDHRHFLASVDGRTAGRISAYWNRDLRDRDGTPVGLVGDFECVPDPAVAHDLFDAATSWLRDSHAASRIWGPMTFDIWHGYRLKTGGFEHPPYLGEPYNQPYYPAMFEREGFSVIHRWDSVELVGQAEIRTLLARGGDRYDALVARGYRFEPVSLRRFREDMTTVHRVIIDSFSGFLGATAISEEAFLDLMLPYRAAVDPRFFFLVYDHEGEPCGFIGAFRDLVEQVRTMRGADSPLGRMRFLAARRGRPRMNLFFGGLTRREAARNSGLGRAGFHHCVDAMARAGVDDLLITLRSQESHARAYVGALNNRRLRTYALYEWRRAS
jgi:hypothetical protein